MSQTLLGNGSVVTTWGGPEPTRVVDAGAVVWEGDRIVAVGPEADLRRTYPDAAFLDAQGGLIGPGFINLHHHFYSALARGLDPRADMPTFAEVLDRLWWRLDRALDLETITLSAEVSAVAGIRWGCTTVFDHHASPNCVYGSLDAIAGVIERAGLSALLCYEITDRNGHEQALRGLDENVAFIEAHHGDARVRGTIGLHASFTLRDDTLETVATRRAPSRVCHIHAAEDPIDGRASYEAFGAGPIQRLERYGLLDDRCLLAHGIHLEPEDYRAIVAADAVIIHNPESNANNAVGRLDTVAVAGYGCRIGLGTDGMSSAVLRALRAAYLVHRAATDPTGGFEALPALLATNALVARRFLDEPSLGELTEGAPADLVVLDAPSPTPLTPDNLFAHLVYGVSESPVRHTIGRGKVLLEDYRHRTLDPLDVADRARRATPAVWQRFHALEWGTSFIG